jgi:Phage integrase family
MKLAGLWQEHGLVFPSQVGTPIGGRNLNRSFKRHLERAGLPRSFRFHDLRHTSATWQETLKVSSVENPFKEVTPLMREGLPYSVVDFSHMPPPTAVCSEVEL